jgi:hypothetical protein
LKSGSKCKTTWDIIQELSSKQYSKADIQEPMIDSKHLKDQQDKEDAFNNYYPFMIGKISKDNAANKIDNGNLFTFHYYLEQNYVHLSSSLVFKTFSIKEITYIITSLRAKKISWVW